MTDADRLILQVLPVADSDPLVPCGFDNGLLLAEPGAGGGCLAEPVRVLCLADLGDQFGLALP